MLTCIKKTIYIYKIGPLYMYGHDELTLRYFQTFILLSQKVDEIDLSPYFCLGPKNYSYSWDA